MYPSYSMNSNINPNFYPNSIPHKDDTFFHQEPHLGQDQNQNQNQNQNPTFFLDQQIHHDLFLHNPPPPTATTVDPHHKINPRSNLKKDRHSKINTAKGPRDRRMRLSLDIARKFFDLQDLLGFDKASKTIEWLLLKSRDAINEVSSNHSPPPPTTYVDGNQRQEQKHVLLKEKVSSKGIISSSSGNINSRERTKNHGFSRKSAYDPMAKESRKAARERAKERTREKNSSSTIDDKCFGLWSPFDTTKDHQSHVVNNIINPIQVHHEQHQDQDHPDHIFTTSNYDHHQNLHGHSNQRHYDEYGNINAAAKTWEAYNSMNLW